MSHREYNSQNVLGTGYYIVLLKGKMFGNNNIESTADVPGELELSRIDCTGVLAFTPTSIRSFSSFLLLSSTISLTSRISKFPRHIVLLLPSSTIRTSLFLLEMAQNTTASSLLTLSTEIHLLIIDCCDHASQYWLSQTCRTFRAMDPVKPLLFCDEAGRSKTLLLRDMER